MRTYNTSEMQTLVESLALGEEIVLRLANTTSLLRWRIINTRQGFQSFVDVSAEENSHFEFLISTPRATQLLARAMVDGQVSALLSHQDARLACVGVGFDGAEALPKGWGRALREGDVVLSWLDQTEHQVGVHLNLDESSTVDIRLIGDEPHVWVRGETLEGHSLHVREHYQEDRSAQLISRLRKRRFDGQVSTGRFTDVQTWKLNESDAPAGVEIRRSWVSQVTE